MLKKVICNRREYGKWLAEKRTYLADMPLKNAQKEVSEQEVSLPESSTNSRRWWLSIAVSLVILLGVIGLQFPTNQLTAEEQHALAEFNKSRTTLLLMSKSFNSVTQELAVMSQFTETKNRILK